MKQKRILSVQDISCFGKCSNTVALPILSAAGVETAILPTALLSTHTGGFTGYTFLDLTVELDKCKAGDTIDLKICRYYDEKGELTGKYEELEFTVTLAMLD